MKRKYCKHLCILLFFLMFFISNKYSIDDMEDFSTPKKCFELYKKSIDEEDIFLMEKCHSDIYLKNIKENSQYPLDKIMKMKIELNKERIRNMQVNQITYIDIPEKVGYNAVLDVIREENGKKKGSFIYLIKENGSWKITLPKKAFENIDKDKAREDILKKEKELEDLKQDKE